MGEKILEYLENADGAGKPQPQPLVSGIQEAMNTIEAVEGQELLQAKARAMKAEYEERERGFKSGNKEGNMEDNQKKVEDAAHVAAEAASAGVGTEEAAGLGSGKSRLVIVKPEAGATPAPEEKGGGWIVLGGVPMRDPEGDYTFGQALKVAQLTAPKASSSDNKKSLSLAEELAEAKQMLEALGVNVGPPPAPASAPRSLKQEVAEAMALLQSLGVNVKTNEQAPLKEQVAEAKSLLEGLGLSVGVPGTSVEERRANFQHEEKMEELKTDRQYKEGLVGGIADLTESIGMGAGREILKGGSVGSQGNPGELETLTCGKCGAKIYITPETKTRVQCPKCGEVYTREISPPAEVEAPPEE